MVQLHRRHSTATLTIDATERPALVGDAASERALLVVTTNGACHAFDFGARTSLTIGRAEPADILLADPSLSRVHACFRREDRAVRVVDLGSRNGTWVAGERIDEALLSVGSSAVLGQSLVSMQLQVVGGVRPKQAAAGHHAARGEAAEPIIRRGRAMLQLHDMVQRVAQHRIGVLLLGETGTGKELVARALHELGPRRNAPLRVVNCAAIPDALVESVLFGHVKGAFTGAARDQPGVFTQAHGGTVFLDEVGELSLDAQAALLRVLDDQRLCPVGGSHDIEVNVRVVAATHRDLAAMTRNSSFRLDLYHRLNALVLRIPPLRERREEIEPLARYFLEHSGSALELLPEALTCLQAYDWPGNVRELRNVIERAIVVCDGHAIGRADLPSELHDERCDIANVAPPEAVAVRDLPAAADAAVDLRARLAEHEIALIGDALRRSAGNRRKAARLLRLPLRTFERKLRIFGPRIPSPQ